MKSKRRSFVVTGVLLLALVLFGSTAARAQAPLVPVQSVTVEALTYDEFLVKWATTNAHNSDTVKEYEVAYAKSTSDTAEFGSVGTLTSVKVAQSREARVVLTGLEAGKMYLVGVRAIPVATSDDTMSSWAYPTPTLTSTEDAPIPEEVLERDITVTVGDMQLGVEWDEPRPDSTKRDSPLMIAEYEVSFAKKADGSDARAWPFTLTSANVTINGLTNGIKYYVAVQSKNSAGGWSEYDWTQAAEGTPMAGAGTVTPTPALPLFGMLALGAGLVSAGRRRLRAQRLLKK